MTTRRFVPLSVGMALFLSACSGSTGENSGVQLGLPERAADSAPSITNLGLTPVEPVTAGDPVRLPPLPAVPGGGLRSPEYVGAIVTPTSRVSTSLTPTLTVPDAAGA